MKTISMKTIKNGTAFEELLNVLNITDDERDIGTTFVLLAYNKLLEYPEVARITIKRLNEYVKRDKLKSFIKAQGKMYGEVIDKKLRFRIKRFIWISTPTTRKWDNGTRTKADRIDMYCELVLSLLVPCVWNDLTNNMRIVRQKFADENAAKHFIEKMEKCETISQLHFCLALESIGIFESVDFNESSKEHLDEIDFWHFSVNGKEYALLISDECSLGNYLSESELDFRRKYNLPGVDEERSDEYFGTVHDCALCTFSYYNDEEHIIPLARTSLIF